MFKTKSSPPSLERYITSSENASIDVFTMCDTGKKYTIWQFDLSRSPGNKFERQHARQ